MSKKLQNIIRGAGSIISVYPVCEDRIKRKKLYKPAISTRTALKSDWQRVGCDIRIIAAKTSSKSLCSKG